MQKLVLGFFVEFPSSYGEKTKNKKGVANVNRMLMEIQILFIACSYYGFDMKLSVLKSHIIL